MVYNDTTNGQGIVQDVYFEASANATSYPIADVTRNANTALDVVVSKILASDGKWQFDSTNATDLPIGVTDLVDGQIDYSFDEDYLVIKSIEVSDANGNWTRLIPIDNNDLLPTDPMTKFEDGGGVPMYYDKMGESILLYPTPNYDLTGGLKAYFQRKIDYFESTDTTKEPGFASHLHKYISLYCAYVYACAKELPKQVSLLRRLAFYEGNETQGGNDAGEIKRFYSYREKDQRKKLYMSTRVKR